MISSDGKPKPEASHEQSPGKFVAYTLAPQDGDRELVVRNLASGSEWRAATGYVPPVTTDQTDEEPGGDAPQQQQGPSLFYTADSKSLVFSILPTKAAVENARKEKKKPEEIPKNGMGIMSLVSGEVARIERVKNFRVPEEGSGYVVYQLEAKPDAARPPKGVEYGTDVVLRSLTDQSERTFQDVSNYTVSRDGRTLVYAVSSKTVDSNGVYAVTAGVQTPPVTLLSGKGKYARLTWDEKQTQLAF